MLSADEDFLVVGAYPPTGTYDECTMSRIARAPQDHPEGAAAAERSGLWNRRPPAETLEEAEMTEYLVRFLVGGVVVSAFAMLSDVLRPKSFAGLFGAAPSVALATLGIAVYRHGPDYAAFQSQAMMAGAIALAVYSVVVCHSSLRTAASGAGDVALARRLADRRFRPADPRRRPDMTPIRFSPSSLREGRWYEYLIRFALGGAVTVFTGIISSRYGPSVGGLFLAFPAIFCASATLIEKHEIRRKREAGSSAKGAGRKPQRSTPPAPRLAPLACWALRLSFR